ncbi:MAG TPA: 3-oxoacyl-ACP synthase III [Phycisphaerae bacterium]|nr:3-oxoacyl-ACP synthase III [Phycisphaerae bacterium]HNU45959.1 3-oxoacyl-ACP synthase III [Phycisphaerae bacterium]
MRYRHVCLEGFGYALPAQVVTSAQLEHQLAPVYERLGVHAGRLELMTGIRERRFWDVDTLPSDAGALAGRHALAKAGVAAEDIGCLLHTAVSRDFLEPATASIIHDKLELPPTATVYDISNACVGFMNGTLALANMIELEQVRCGLIVAGESGRSLVESTIKDLCRTQNLSRQQFKNAFASLTIGSGAAAVVLTHDSVSRTGHRLLGGAVRSATQHHHLCLGTGDVGFDREAAMLMNTQAETLLVNGCALAETTWQAARVELGWTNADVQRCYCHQVGSTHRDKLYAALGLDPALDFSTFEYLGNVGSASLPLTMALGLEERPAAAGERIGMLGIGSGLNCVMLGVRW